MPLLPSLALGAAVAAAALTPSRAFADGREITTCVGRYGAATCSTSWQYGPVPHANIRYVDGPAGKQQEEAALERDRKWLAHCKPRVQQDQYGVDRLSYAAPGCEYGKSE